MADQRKMAKPSFATQVAETIIKQLEEGTAPWQRPWEPGTLSHVMPYNAATGKRYRGGNSLWLMMQPRNDSRWMTYKQAASLGAQVRKGEKGTVIEYVKRSEERLVRDEAGKPVLDENGNNKTEMADLQRGKLFRAVVFNAEQIDGLPPLERRAEPSWSVFEAAERALETSGVALEHVNGNRAYYSPSSDRITLPERGQFPSADRYYETALHELGHATGHPSRLARDLQHPFGSEGYAREELRAELASLMLGDRLGIGFDPGNHAAYVASWIKVLQDDPREIFRAASDAEKITAWVTDRALTHEQHEELDRAIGVGTQSSANERESAQNNAIIPGPDRASIDVEQASFVSATLLQAARDGLAPEARKLAVLEAMAERDGLPLDQIAGNRFIAEQLVPTIAAHHDGEKVTRIYSAGDDQIATPLAASYTELVRAERAFQGELERLHGDQANVRRYDWNRDDEGLAKARQGFHEAGKNYSETIRAERASEQENDMTTSATRTYLAVPFRQKDEAKQAGAKWDKEAKAWFAPEGADLESLKRWIPEKATAERIESPVEELTAFLRSHNFLLDGDATMDGTRQRVPVKGDKGAEKTGYYRAYSDGHPAAHVVNHKTGLDTTWKWSGKTDAVSAADRARIAEDQAKKREARDAAEKATHLRTANAIDELLSVAPKVPTHPYADAKGIQGPFLVVPQTAEELSADSPIRIAKNFSEAATLREKEPDAIVLKAGDLLIVAHDQNGKTMSAQWIDESGRKGFVAGGQISGSRFTLLQPNSANEPIFIAEGWATAKKIAEATGATTLVAFSANNLEAVAKSARAEHPNRPIVIAGDNDHEREDEIVAASGLPRGNAGRTKAQAAANEVGGYAAIPDFAKGEKGSDWDDYARKHGIGAVTKAMDEAKILADRRMLADAQLTGHDAERVAEVVKLNQAEQAKKQGAAASTTPANYEDLRRRADKEADKQDTSDEAPEPEEHEQVAVKKADQPAKRRGKAKAR